MQVATSAQANPRFLSDVQQARKDVVKLPAVREPAMGAMTRKAWNSVLLLLCVLVVSVSPLVPTLVAQTGNVVISTNTTWATGTYNLTSLSVENGATLTVGGGSTVTVSGAVLVTANSNVVLQSINNAAQVSGSWQGAGVTVNAGSVQVDAGSSINADGQGYTASSGPGGGAGGSSTGGSYGGAGGGQAGSTVYGSATEPVDLGSGGGQYQGTTQPGGGAIRLVVSGMLTDNGIISANAPAVCCFVGGSAGGSVYVTAGKLTGSGTFNADGGSNTTSYGNAGGGGRVAVYYNATGSSFAGFTGSTASGGTAMPAGNGGVAGAVGTVAFFDTSATNDDVMVYQDFVLPAGSNVQYNSLTVTNGATLTIGGGSTVTVAGEVLVTANSTIVLQSINTKAQVNGTWQGAGVTINAGSVQVDSGSSINADGQGYTVSSGPGAAGGGTSNGGSYGGAGGGQAASTIYGSATAPVDLGSGGGQYQGTTQPGGGAVRLIVTGKLTDNGIISANGAAVSGFVGGSAGGSVYVTAGSIAGSGTFNANGGSNSSSYGNAGGGGRVAVYYNGTQSSFTGFAGSTVSGGVVAAGNGAVGGGVGTIAFFDTSAMNSNVTVYQNYVIPAGSSVHYNSLTVTNGGLVTVGGNSTLTVTGGLKVAGNSTLVLESANTTAQVDGVWAGVGDTIQAGSLEVDAGSSINADAQGYTASNGPGGAAAGTTNGGSYGGAGGGQAASTIYGSATAPVDLGSGGGSYESIGGTGGGAMHLVVSGALTNDGVISANGGTFIVCTGSGACGGGFAGGGGGGSIDVSTARLAGSGTFNANGGSNVSSYGNGGGGGRVAVYYDATQSSFTGFTGSTASGGVAPTGNGAVDGTVGTIAFFDTSATNDDVAVYQNYVIPAGSNVQYNSLTVTNGATLTVGGGSTLTVAGAMLVTADSTVVLQSANTSAQVNGAWAGVGDMIQAGSLEVDAGSSISADAQGYTASNGPGGGTAGTTNGGSYGGLGGGQAASTIYGSSMVPVDLGSGGGGSESTGGTGGGAMHLVVSGALTNNGVVSANGGTYIVCTGSGACGGGFAGGGAGGSINVSAGSLAGSGTFNANGGSNASSYGDGGGGGRVIVFYNAAQSSFTGFTGSTVSGGTVVTGNGAVAGALGTFAFFDTSVMNDNVTVYQNFTLPAQSSPTYNSATVENGALLTIGGGSTITVTDALTVDGTVVAQSANTTAQVNGAWAGSGVAINAGSLMVNSAGSLNADMQGYVGGAGPGGAPAGTSAGGSYGGLGGVGDGASPAPIYGSEMLPVDLGSGGGTRCCGTTPGAGGGDLLLTVSGTLTDDGVISANGGDGTGTQVGGGSGGSVSIHTPTLTGTGSIAANGGAGGEAGGGGGRVALYFNTASGFNEALATATGGTSSGGNAGAVGTVYIPGALVVKATSTTTLSATPIQANAGQGVTFQAFVTAAMSGTTASPTPTGNVNFFDGTTLIGTQALGASQQNGTALAQFQTTALAVGTHSITASYAGDANVLASTSSVQTVTVSQAATTSTLGLSAATIVVGQTETLTLTIAGGIANPAVAGTVSFFDTTANAGLGTLSVTPTSTGGTATLAVTNLTVGTHVLNAVYSGNSNYLSSTAANQTVVVTAKTQTITFAPIPDHVFGDAPFTLAATASSNLPVSYAVTSGPATVSGDIVTITGAGTVAIQATQAGNATTYAAATPVTRSFAVAQATQTITFPAIPNHAAGDAPFQLNATASSGLAVSYAVTSGPATIAGNLVTLTGAGTVQIQATQAGSANYAAATPVNQSFTVSLQSQTITFPAIPNHMLGDAPFALSATASSGLTVTYSVTSGPATVSASTVTLTGAGAVVIQAAQAGNTIYAAAAPVTQSFTISSPLPTLASIAPAGGVVGSGATTITLTGSDFASTDTVQLNGAAIATTFVSSTTLTAIVPANFLAATATGQITVFDSVTKSTTAAQSFSVLALPDVNFSGPPTAASASQPSLTFQLVNPYPFPIAGSLSLAFAPSGADGTDDPAVQFATGGRTLLYTIPALSQVTPTVQIQSGTVAGVATVTLVVTSNGVNVTPANVAPVEITIPPIVPMITTAAVTRSGTTLTVVMHGFSNTRELSTAKFHFTAVTGSTVATPDLTLPVTTVFGDYFASPAAVPYGSTFVYTQTFNLNNDASSIQNVMVTLVNSVGDSIQVTTQ